MARRLWIEEGAVVAYFKNISLVFVCRNYSTLGEILGFHGGEYEDKSSGIFHPVVS
jgi:hypothetical protein